MNMSDKLILELFEKGFVVKEGRVYSKKKEIKLQLNSSGYYVFSHRMKDGKTRSIHVHRLVAYKKFGNRIFNEKLQVRHLDGNPKNNFENNIELGTPSQNTMDKNPEVRLRVALEATNKVRIHDHDSIIEDRKKGFTYYDLMKKYNISSKGVISFIINKSYSLRKK